MNKEKIIIFITARIKSECKKHKDIEWERIAAYKIYSTINKLYDLNPTSISIGKFCSNCGKRTNMKGDGSLELLCEC